MYKFTSPTGLQKARTPTQDMATPPTGLDPLVLYAVRELGAICTIGDFEAQAEILLAQAEDIPAWRRRWAALAEAAGWPCFRMTWQEWVRYGG